MNFCAHTLDKIFYSTGLRVREVHAIGNNFLTDDTVEAIAQVLVASLSEEYGFSISYLSHLFKRITGNSVMGYLQACRMAAAKKYLAETDLEVGAIVEKCGFSDASNFSRSFKHVTGSTPTKFRAQFNTSRINLN